MRELSRYMQGAVKIGVQGAYIERFVNLCIEHRINLWSVAKYKEGLSFWLLLSDFFLIRPYVRKTKVKVCVIKRYGIPFRIKQWKKRKILLGGICAFFIALYILSSYVWFIEVVGEKKVLSDKILIAAAEEGLQVGTRLDDKKFREVEKKLLIKLPELAWVGIDISGTKVKIEVVEKVLEPMQEHTPADIIASKDGMVIECIPITGESKVKEGDSVKNGDVLILGVNELQEDVRAKGIVRGKIKYESVGQADLVQQYYNLTGEKMFAFSISVNEYKWKWLSSKDVYDAYEHTSYRKNIVLWRNQDIVVELNIDVYYELMVEFARIAEAEAKQIALTEAMRSVGEKIPRDAYILNQNIEIKQQADVYTVDLTIETEEEIGIYKQKE